MKKKLRVKEGQFAENEANDSSFSVENGKKTQKLKHKLPSLDSLAKKILKSILKDEKRQGRRLRKQEKMQKKCSRMKKNACANV